MRNFKKKNSNTEATSYQSKMERKIGTHKPGIKPFERKHRSLSAGSVPPVPDGMARHRYCKNQLSLKRKT